MIEAREGGFKRSKHFVFVFNMIVYVYCIVRYSAYSICFVFYSIFEMAIHLHIDYHLPFEMTIRTCGHLNHRDLPMSIYLSIYLYMYL